MTTADKIKQELDHLDEPQLQTILMMIHTWNNPLEDKYDENGHVIVDAFYQSLLDGIDEDDEGIEYTEEELRKELGL